MIPVGTGKTGVPVEWNLVISDGDEDLTKEQEPCVLHASKALSIPPDKSKTH